MDEDEKSTELHEVPLGRSASLSDYEVTKGTQAPPSPQQRKSLLVEAVPEDDVEIGEPVSKKELYSWYTYDWANSVYLNSVIGSFMPSFLTLLAQDNMSSDGKLHFLGSKVQPASFYTYCVTTSVILQALCFVVFGGMADFGTIRKPMLVICGVVGSLATIAIIVVEPSIYWLGGLLLIISNVGFGLSVVFYNSFLPLLVKNHPEVRAATDEAARAELEKLYDRKISNIGYVSGYIGGVVMLVINVGLFLALPTNCLPKCKDCPNPDHDICPEEPECPSDYDPNNCDGEFWGYRVNLAVAGIWWLGFALITYTQLQPRASKPLPEGTHYITEGLKKLKNTLRDLKKLPNAFRFLMAYWLYSDGFSTIFYGASLMATELLSWTGTQLGIAFIAANLSAGLGNWFYHKISQCTCFGRKIQVKHVICINIFIVILITLYARLPGTFKYDAELYVLSIIFGFQNGSMQSFSRVLLSRLVPEGHEAEFFSFYELTDKGTSWAGPLVMGIVMDATGDIRWGVFAVLFFCIAGGCALHFGIHEEQGAAEAKQFAEDEKSKA